MGFLNKHESNGLFPDAERAADVQQLSEMIRVVVGEQQQCAQVGLLLVPGRNARIQIPGVAGDLFHLLAIAREGGDAGVPRPAVGRRRVLRPVVVGPLAAVDVLGVDAEIEDVFLRDAHVLEQLPGGVIEAGRPRAALVGGTSSTALSNPTCDSSQSSTLASCSRRRASLIDCTIDPMPETVNATPPGVAAVTRIAAMANPVIRNLEITECYADLSAAMRARTGDAADWCTFATWASRQAGSTIRGEDLLDSFDRRLGREAVAAGAARSRSIACCCARGSSQPGTVLGRVVAAIHTPFDAFERASAEVADGNLKVFEEIGREFARFMATVPVDARQDSPEFVAFAAGLRPGEPPDGQDCCARRSPLSAAAIRGRSRRARRLDPAREPEDRPARTDAAAAADRRRRRRAAGHRGGAWRARAAHRCFPARAAGRVSFMVLPRSRLADSRSSSGARRSSSRAKW